MPTAYRTCTFACDPRGAATIGCPTGLHCFVVDTMDQVDCACTAATQTQTEGQACTRGSDCAPGLICDRSTTKCQKVCKRGAGSSDCADRPELHRADQRYDLRRLSVTTRAGQRTAR